MLKILYCLIFSCSPFVQPFEFKVKVSTLAASEWFHLKLNVVIYRTKISKESCLCIYLLMRHCHVFLSAKSLLPTAPQTPNLTSTTAANQPSSPAGATGAFQVNPLPSSSSSHERRDKHSRRRRGERKGESRVKDKVK